VMVHNAQVQLVPFAFDRINKFDLIC
jgi:hypothetical protein